MNTQIETAGTIGERGTMGCHGVRDQLCVCPDGGKIQSDYGKVFSSFIKEFGEKRIICNRCNCYTKHVDKVSLSEEHCSTTTIDMSKERCINSKVFLTEKTTRTP